MVDNTDLLLIIQKQLIIQNDFLNKKSAYNRSRKMIVLKKACVSFSNNTQLPLNHNFCLFEKKIFSFVTDNKTNPITK